MANELQTLISRRRFLTTTMACVLTAPLAAEAQRAGNIYRVGVMFVNPRQPLTPFINALEEGFRDRGYQQGRDLAIEYRFAEGRSERLPALAAELARLNVDVFVVGFNTQAEIVR